MLELREVTRALDGQPFLSGLSLEIASGRLIAMAGFEAAGRGAIARLLSGVDKPQGGTIRLGGKDVQQARKDKGRIVKVGPAGAPPSGQKVGKLIGAEAMRAAGLAGQAEARVASLSPDRRMRLALAIAVAARPSLLILDAPASQIDEAAREPMLADMARTLVGFAGVCVLIASCADEVVYLAQDLVVMHGGQVVQAGTVDEIAARPLAVASARATAAPTLNTLPVVTRGERSLLPDGSRLQLPEGLPPLEQGAYTLAFRPADVTLERATPGCVRFVVRGGGEERRGERQYLHVKFGGADWLCPAPAATPHAGAVLNAFVDKSRLMIFDGEGRLRG